MPPAMVNRLEAGHAAEPNDCAILALANYLGLDYTDVIRIAARLVDDGGKSGLTYRTIRRIASLCGTPMRMVRVFDPEDAYGIVLVQWRGHNEAHAAVLREGWVQDRNLVYAWDDWLEHMRQLVKTPSGRPRALSTRLLTV